MIFTVGRPNVLFSPILWQLLFQFIYYPSALTYRHCLHACILFVFTLAMDDKIWMRFLCSESQCSLHRCFPQKMKQYTVLHLQPQQVCSCFWSCQPKIHPQSAVFWYSPSCKILPAKHSGSSTALQSSPNHPLHSEDWPTEPEVHPACWSWFFVFYCVAVCLLYRIRL